MTIVSQPEPASVAETVALASDLPEGWVEATLDRLLQTVESGSRPKGGVRGIKEGIPSIGGEHLDENGGFRFQSIKFVPHWFFERMNRGRIQTGDILIVKDGATTGKVVLVRDNFPYNPAVVNEHVFICRPPVGVCPPFLFYFLFSKEGQDRILENFRGSAQGGINQSFAPGTVVPLAPLMEQKRIVAKVEQLLARVNAARERLAKVPVTLKHFRQSVLAAACSGRLTAEWRDRNFGVEPASERLRTILAERRAKWEATELFRMKSRGSLPRKDKWKKKYRGPLSPSINNLPELDETWTWATIDQVTAHEPNAITDGPFGSNLKTAHYTEVGPRVIRLQNIGDGIFIDEHAHISDEHFEKLAKHRIFHGDVIIATLGDPITRSCDLPDHIGPAIVKADCIRLKPHHDLAVRRYTAYTLNDHSTRMRMAEVVHGVGRARLNLREVKAIPVPLPPLVEQHEIVRRVEALFKLADIIEKRVSAATAQAEKLVQAILAKAFRGELVPTEAELARREDRSYEPASALLAKIEAQRENVNPQRKRGR